MTRGPAHYYRRGRLVWGLTREQASRYWGAVRKPTDPAAEVAREIAREVESEIPSVPLDRWLAWQRERGGRT